MKVKRNFIIGDEWLYYKIYTGHKTSEKILTEIIKPITEELLNKKIIDKWFFIRYNDPKFHLRIRFHITGDGIKQIINFIQTALKDYTENFHIHSIQIDTYKRELERYGKNTIEEAENLFGLESIMVTEMADAIEGDDGEEIRWKFAIKAVDVFYSDFGFNLNMKLSIFEILKDNFGKEFNFNKNLKKQLDNKFRENRTTLESILKNEGDEYNFLKPVLQHINTKSNNSKPIVKKILDIKKQNKLKIEFHNLMSSYSHMLINRIFLVNPRLNEYVIYYLLHKYYKSEIARNKARMKQKQLKKLQNKTKNPNFIHSKNKS